MTRLMVLGMLHQYGPMSGYEIQLMLQKTQTDLWAGVFPASIYHALRKLEEEGFVHLDNIEQTGNRSKAIYSITPAGKDQFDRLLLDAFRESSAVFPTTLYTALTFLEAATPEHVLRSLTEQQTSLRSLLAQLKSGEQAKSEAADVPEYATLTFRNMFDQIELQLQFLAKLQQLLEQRKER